MIVSLTQPASNAVVTVVNGKFVVTPVAGFVGTVTFSYVVVGADGTQDTVTVTAHVLGEALTLPFTGMDVGSLGLIAFALVIVGVIALWFTRRSRKPVAPKHELVASGRSRKAFRSNQVELGSRTARD